MLLSPMYVPIDVLPNISACGCRRYLVPPGKVFARGGLCRSHVIIFVFYRLLLCGELPPGTHLVPWYQVLVPETRSQAMYHITMLLEHYLYSCIYMIKNKKQ